MKLTRVQKASLLKEIGNLIAYFDTPKQMDVKNFISILKQKHSSWQDVETNEETIKEVSAIMGSIEKALNEQLFEPSLNPITNDEKVVTVVVVGSNASTDYLSSELAVFEDESILIDKDLDQLNESFSFTGFSTENFQDTNAISISPNEFWYGDEENTDNFND